MTPTETKHQIDAMSDEDRFFAAAYLEHLSHAKDAAYRLSLSERMRRMDSGKKVSLEQLEGLHLALEPEGV
ncbi:hypothetical protein [Prosthecobacter sp.]|uniref:hypothetical protein n=1 Tax=Prosthecobacter sp. TaxID=1965333 RepID=UPI003784B6CA